VAFPYPFTSTTTGLRPCYSTISDVTDVRRLIYTTDAVESYHRQLRKVTKTKAVFPDENSLRKVLYLATMDILK
jgi:transposase-like protein